MQTNPEIYKNNMEALQKKYPDLALMLSLVKIENYQLAQQGNCLPNVIVNGQFYYLGNMKDYCEEQFKGFELNNVKIPVICGFGLGYEIMYWMQFKSKEMGTQAIIIFEKDPELFMCAMNVVDLVPLINNPRIHLFIGVPTNKLYSVLREYYTLNLAELLMCGVTQPVFLYPAMRMHKDYYMKCIQTLFETAYHSINNFGNSAEDSLIGLENMLDNIDVIVNNPGINLLYDKFKGKPAVIVATGPSLKKNMQLLKDYDGLIISVDASFKLLMKNGIKPHMITSLEREHEVQQFFEGFEPEEVKDIYMTACPVLYNHVYESYVGPQIVVYRNFDHFKWLQVDKGILDIKLSSSNMAFKVAEALGCNPIVLIGQDLAYGPDGETHATEVPFSSEGEGIFEVRGNVEERVKTNSGWYNFLKAYEYDIANYRGSVINCTEGGAYIEGTQVKTFGETLKLLKPYDALKIIQDNLHFENTSDIQKISKLMLKTESDIKKIINLCKIGVRACKKYENELKNDIDVNMFNEIRKEMVSPRIEIQNNYGDTFQKFLMHVVQSAHLKFEMEAAMLNDYKKVLAKFIEWYAFIGDISQICLESLLKAREKIHAGER